MRCMHNAIRRIGSARLGLSVIEHDDIITAVGVVIISIVVIVAALAAVLFLVGPKFVSAHCKVQLVVVHAVQSVIFVY